MSSAYRFESLYLYGAGEVLTGQSCFLALPALNPPGFPLFLAHFTAPDPTSFPLLWLDKGAFHKARAWPLPPTLGLLFFLPDTPEPHPIEHLWRDLKDWLAHYQSASLKPLSKLLSTRLTPSSVAPLRSLTGFPYFLKTAQTVTIL